MSRTGKNVSMSKNSKLNPHNNQNNVKKSTTQIPIKSTSEQIIEY